jgi:hypothetical protein
LASTQSDVEGHAIELSVNPLSIDTIVQAPWPPVGLEDTSAFAQKSTAAQNEAVGQETPFSGAGWQPWSSPYFPHSGPIAVST